MSIIDIALILICMFFAIRAGIRGFVVEIFSLLAFVVGVWGAVKLFPIATTIFNLHPEEISPVIKLLIYGGLFLLLYILVKILEKIISKFVKVILLAGLNKVLGVVLGLTEAMLVIQVLTTILINQEIFDVDFGVFFGDSQILKYVNTYLAKGKVFLGI